MIQNQDLVNAIWLVALVGFLFYLFRSQITNIYRNLFRGNFGRLEPQQPPVQLTEAEDKELSRRLGIMTGTMGGTIEDAAAAKYALLRSMKPGQRPSDEDIARAVSMTLSSNRGGFGNRDETGESPSES